MNPAAVAQEDELTVWHEVCDSDRLESGRGVAVLVGEHQIALFRIASGELFAVDHVDPFTGTSTIARGLTGSHHDGTNEELFVAAPLYKQRFNLRTGVCLDDGGASLRTWRTKEAEGAVFIATSPV